jgi:Fe-S cluster assembly protein SufB
MSDNLKLIEEITGSEYKYGFVSNFEADAAPMGLTEDTVRFISAKKNEPEWMLHWRLKAYHHWLTLKEPKRPLSRDKLSKYNLLFRP